MNAKGGSRPLLLLDRDGTLIEERHYLSNPDDVQFLPGVISGLKKLKRAGFSLVVVSNQSGVGRGLITLKQVQRVNRRFLQMLKVQKTNVDGVYLCPHRPSDRCCCRKPKLGMVKRAGKDLGMAWKRSISVGDRPSDVTLGQKTGGLGVLVRTGYGQKWVKAWPGRKPAYIANDFMDAVRWILKTTKRSGYGN